MTVCTHWIGTWKLKVQAPIKTINSNPKKDNVALTNVVLARMGGGAKPLNDFTRHKEWRDNLTIPWLLLAFRIKSEILNKIYEDIHLTSSHLCIPHPPTPLIPSIHASLVRAPTTQACFQVRECITQAPYCWRSLPFCSLCLSLCLVYSYLAFKSQLNSHFFREAFPNPLN